MITGSDVLRIVLPAWQVRLCFEHAETQRHLKIGRTIPGEALTASSRKTDFQMTAQLGHAAFFIAMFPNGWELYREQRLQQEATKWVGDGGTDVPGGTLDVKSTRRSTSRLLRYFNLVVRPMDYRPKTTYALAVVDHADGSTSADVWLMGWSQGVDLWIGKDTLFPGDYHYLPAAELKPLIRMGFPQPPKHAPGKKKADLNILMENQREEESA